MNTTAPAQPEGFWHRYLLGPIMAQLSQGITPQKIALTLALGAVISVFPVFGATTLLCGVVGVWLRLNQPLIQALNYLLTPVHVALLLPFYRAGEALFGQPPVPIFSVGDLIARFEASPLQFVLDYGMVGVYGVTVWALVAPVAAILLYLLLHPVLQRLPARATAD
ncbi:MAG: DUF2062 domain-containing protein [Nevskiales bacterium]|nr:DUF2062 domain-containing protein [Nevskiales bacterium]